MACTKGLGVDEATIWCPSLDMDSYTLRVILFHEFWKSPLQLVNTTVFLNSKQHLLTPIFSKMQIDRRKRLFVAERTTSKSDFFIFSKQVNMGIKRSVFSSLIQRRKLFKKMLINEYSMSI